MLLQVVNFTSYRLIRKTLKTGPNQSREENKIDEAKGAECGLEEKKGGGHRRLCFFHPPPPHHQLGTCYRLR